MLVLSELLPDGLVPAAVGAVTGVAGVLDEEEVEPDDEVVEVVAVDVDPERFATRLCSAWPIPPPLS